MLIVVGGEARHVGKTAVAAAIIRAFPRRRWMAVKITRHAHGLPARGISLVEEQEEGETGTGRYLAAGAARAFLVSSPAGKLPEALARLPWSRNSIFESTSAAELLRPDIYLMVLGPPGKPVKLPARKSRTRVDAFVSQWTRPSGLPGPFFSVQAPSFMSADLRRFLYAAMRKLAATRSRPPASQPASMCPA